MRLAALAFSTALCAAPALAQLVPYQPPAPFNPSLRAAPPVFPEGEFRAAPPAQAGGGAKPKGGDFLIQGANNFRKVADLPKDHPDVALSRMVGQLWFNIEDKKWAPLCSGSLVGPNVFLTNFHCVVDLETGTPFAPTRLAVVMDHYVEGQLGGEGALAIGAMVLKSDFVLDYALIALDRPLGETFGWLDFELDPSALERVTAVKIIQHPDGRSKEIVIEETEVVQRQWPFIHYLADTEGGSSGSPVFELDGRTIIALHHAGIEGKFNEGIEAPRIAAEAALYLPQPKTAQAGPQGGAPAPSAVRPGASERLGGGAAGGVGAGAKPLFGN